MSEREEYEIDLLERIADLLEQILSRLPPPTETFPGTVGISVDVQEDTP
jgi:hypothetical protein